MADGDDVGFGSSRRLRQPGEYSAVFSWRRVVRGGLFDLHYRPAIGLSARLGLAIAKKQARHAVVRNAVKRVAREAFRLAYKQLPAFDLVLRLAKPIANVDTASRRLWRAEIEVLFKRLPRADATKEIRQ